MSTNMPENKLLQNKPMEARHYQLELLEYLTERNGIVYLPTGAGKTFVAILALKRFSSQLEKTIENGGKRAIFMTNTVELARQQAITVKKITNLKIGFYVGERDVDNWSRKKWEIEIAENQVLVGTAQIFLDIVTQKYISITDLSIVIIDECHHATKNHPMHEFMRLFQYADQKQLPRVIGLTGVLLKGNKINNIVAELSNLEATYRGNIVTVSSMEQYQNVMVYSTKPREELICYSGADHNFDISDVVIAIINELIAVVESYDLGKIAMKLSKGLQRELEPNKKKNIINLLKDFIHQMNEYGLYAAAISIMSPIIEFEIKKRQAETLALRNLYRIVITKCEYIRHILVKKLNELNDDESDIGKLKDTLEMIFNYSTPKLRALLMQMKTHFVGKTPNDISCLIFVERRYTAKCIYFVVKKFVELTPELRDIVRPQFMVGRNSIAPGIASILDQKWDKKAIESFRDKECNVIICSNVLEEGIDVQACNYVFVFDPLKTFNSYIQTKGRARSVNSVYGIFAPKLDEIKVVQQIKKYKEIHEIIKKYLIGRILDRDDPNENNVAAQFVDNIPPFMSKSGAILLASSALQILNRYCQTLPSDVFGAATPWFCKANDPITGKNVVACRLPIQSTVKETIYSDCEDTTKMMKISAAFKACKLLYERGELNEKLLPITKQECIGIVANELFQHWKTYDDDVTSRKQGKQFRRLYDRMCPEELYGAMPIVGEKCYAYEVEFKTHFASDSYTSHIIDMMNVKSGYALLLRHRLPRLAEMPLFMNQGRLSVKIAETPVECCIKNNDELEQLRKFHLMVFRDLLQLWKSFFVLDNRNKENSYLLVPLVQVQSNSVLPQKQIDWNLVRDFQRLLPTRSYSIFERQQKLYRPEDYLGKVISKWYGSDDDYYVVTAVRTDMSPKSAFEGENFSTYEEFTLSRFGHTVQQIVQPNQFLLEVRGLTTRRNFFINATGKTSARSRKHNTIRLIPELCHNFMYPGDMWLKAIFLPSILHRLHYMLHADTLRRRINRFLELPLSIESDYRPKELMVDTSLKRVVDYDGNAIEEEEEPKKLLPALPFKEKQSDFTVRSLMDDEKVTWKPYLEPVDHARLTDSIYPVEVDYYYKFIQGLAADLDRLKLQEEEEWSTSQLDMAPITPQIVDTNSAHRQMVQLSITDAPLADKRRIDILERSFKCVSVNNIQTAEQYELLAAITTSKANDVFDMERLEILGDSFLKFSATLYLVNKYPQFHEGFLTEIKSRLVSNRNLLYCLLSQDIPKRICSIIFNPKAEWMPPLASLPYNILSQMDEHPNITKSISPSSLFALELDYTQILKGVCSDKQLDEFISECNRNVEAIASGVELLELNNETNLFLHKTTMPDKVIADTLEALLGVCIKNYGIHRGFRMLEFFGICRAGVNEKPLKNLLDLNLNSSHLRTNITTKEVDGFLTNHSSLEKNLGYTFRDRAYLLQALTHPSYPTNRLTGSYQELEFIGDAILDFLVSCYIYERFERMTPGQVTDLRSALVNNITLGCICVRHRFHLFLLAENSALSESIKNFADFQETQQHRVTDQVRILLEEDFGIANATVLENSDDGDAERKRRLNLAVNVDVPKALGDIVEALIAAVYLDSLDLVQTWNVIYSLLEPEFIAFSQQVPLDPVRELFEHKSANAKFSDAIVDDEVVMMKCMFSCLDKCIEVNGFGVNSQQAKKSAAKHALKILAKHST